MAEREEIEKKIKERYEKQIDKALEDRKAMVQVLRRFLNI